MEVGGIGVDMLDHPRLVAMKVEGVHKPINDRVHLLGSWVVRLDAA
jgi:hypothetical protein